ncbi:MAG: Copper chaperone PCu(A)C [Actinomycetota bacterium]|nr:Copper chaperone PCu(A)C [Actinomycetota bacterium]
MNVKPLAMVGVAGVALVTLTACPANSSSTSASVSPSASSSAPSASASTICPLTVSDAFVKTAESGSTEAIGTVKNTSSETIKITGASSPAAATTELRKYVDQNGSATTEPVTDWAVSAGSSIQLTDNFLLLVDLKYPITADQEVPITLKCQAGDQTGQSFGVQMTFSARGRDDLYSGGGYTPQQSTSPSYSMSPSWSGSPSPSWSPTTTSPTTSVPTTAPPTNAPTLQAPKLTVPAQTFAP